MIKMPNWVENILEVRGGADTLREFRGPSDKHAVSKEPGVHKYTFDTANAAPYDWAVEAAAQHPELNVQLTYGEDGNFYGGQIVFEHGVKKSHVGGPYHAFFYTDSDVEDEASVEDEYTAKAQLVRDGPDLLSWLRERDPDTYWHLSMRGVFGEPMMGGAKWYPGLKPVTVEELTDAKRRLTAKAETETQRREAFAAATAMMEKCAEYLPDGAYKEMYDALKSIYDTVNSTEDPTNP